MKTFKVRLTETLEKEVEIEADSKAEALAKAHNNYVEAGDGYILTADNCTSVDLEVIE